MPASMNEAGMAFFDEANPGRQDAEAMPGPIGLPALRTQRWIGPAIRGLTSPGKPVP